MICIISFLSKNIKKREKKNSQCCAFSAKFRWETLPSRGLLPAAGRAEQLLTVAPRGLTAAIEALDSFEALAILNKLHGTSDSRV